MFLLVWLNKIKPTNLTNGNVFENAILINLKTVSIRYSMITKMYICT